MMRGLTESPACFEVGLLVDLKLKTVSRVLIASVDDDGLLAGDVGPRRTALYVRKAAGLCAL